MVSVNRNAAWGATVTIEASYFSLASIAALVVFLAIMAPQAITHTVSALVARVKGRVQRADHWLVAIAVSILFCAGLAVGTGVFNTKAHNLLNQSEAVTLSFLLFALPSVLQVARAWFNSAVAAGAGPQPRPGGPGDPVLAGRHGDPDRGPASRPGLAHRPASPGGQ